MILNKPEDKIYNARIVLKDGSILTKALDVKEFEKGFDVTLAAADIPKDTDYIDIMPDFANAKEGDEGYMVGPKGGPYCKNSYFLCEFHDHKECEYVIDDCALPIFGFKNGENCFVNIVTGLRFEFSTVIGKCNDTYYIYARFIISGKTPYEDIKMRCCYLYGDEADYSGMARKYRNYQLEREACVPIKERAKNNEALEYAAKALSLRIRLGMKPLPTPVMEQTLENEPQMCVACTFNRLKDLVDELKRQKIENVEFCLVGWNLKGHDGRYPEMFPVEEELGGEKDLREAIQYAKDNRYHMACHSNSSDAYTISSMWNEEDILVLENGEMSVDPNAWSGGRMYQLCPKIGLEQAKVLLPKIAELGFRGIHYIDVISLHPPRECYSKKHPLNKKEAVECNDELMSLTKKLFGGFSSEGAYDVNIGNLDFALLVHNNTLGEQPEFVDRVIPLWELVYHGIVLHNTSWETGNDAYTSDEFERRRNARLKNIEFGGRPMAYFHHLFTGHEAELKNGLNTADDETMKKSVSIVKEVYEDFEKLSSLQYEFMEKHEKVSEGVFKTTYSNNVSITVDYNKLTYTVK